MDLTGLRRQLFDLGIFEGEEIVFTPLKGGVSSDIYLVQNGVRKYVLKQALSQLRVEEEWLADVNRNLAEQDFIRYVADFSPENVPAIIYADRENAFFLMSYYGPPYQNWKISLMAGEKSQMVTSQAASLLAKIHSHSYKNQKIADQFNHKKLFLELRIEPYILFTSKKYPKWSHLLEAEANRLLGHTEALMHGDFSPKNILAKDDHVLLLDHEVACYGDPAFDIAFMLNHLLLKRLVFSHKEEFDPKLPLQFWERYFQQLEIGQTSALRSRTIHLLKILMLARVDGKSPAEYLGEEHRNWIRRFFSQSIQHDFGEDFYAFMEFFDEMKLNDKN